MKNEEIKKQGEELELTDEDLWGELCELIRYHIFEGTLDKEFLEEAAKYFKLERK